MRRNRQVSRRSPFVLRSNHGQEGWVPFSLIFVLPSERSTSILNDLAALAPVLWLISEPTWSIVGGRRNRVRLGVEPSKTLGKMQPAVWLFSPCRQLDEPLGKTNQSFTRILKRMDASKISLVFHGRIWWLKKLWHSKFYTFVLWSVAKGSTSARRSKIK